MKSDVDGMKASRIEGRSAARRKGAPRIVTLGEAILDLVFKGGRPVRAVPGGSMLNTAVSLGRLGLPVSLVSEVGRDPVGGFILGFLEANGVDTSYVGLAGDGKTPLALAFLDARGKAGYDFYRLPPARRLCGPAPDFKAGDLVLFGSHFSLDRAVRRTLAPMIESARRAGAIVIYDPNLRRRAAGLGALVERNLRLADIVKGSDDDFLALFGTADPDAVFERLRRRGVGRLVMTRGPRTVFLRTDSCRRAYAVKKVRVRSTIGAGDNFSAGLLSGLLALGATRASLGRMDDAAWDAVVERGILFARDVCRSYGNFISAALASRLRTGSRLAGRK